MAIDWLAAIGLERVAAHEARLLRHTTDRLSAIPGIELVGTAPDKAGAVSFVVKDPPIATLDIATQLDLQGVCVRTGHHCCMPLMDRLGLSSTARASFGVYNTVEEIDILAEALAGIVERARDAQSKKVAPAAGLEVVYPIAAADSPVAAAEEIRDIFDCLPDWTMRYQQIIDLGERLPTMPVALKTEANYVAGCQSQVHLAARVRPGTPDTIEFLADSDADIVRGLIALLEHIFSGQRAADILAFDAPAFFAEIGLDQHLSLTRRNGLASMLQRIRQLASQLAE